jgi:hypothetical protein
MQDRIPGFLSAPVAEGNAAADVFLTQCAAQDTLFVPTS